MSIGEYVGAMATVPPDALFAALADRTRLRLLSLMAGREVCVCFLVEAVDAPQPTVSRHLAYLRRSGIVAARRDGKWMHYRIDRATLGTGGAATLDAALAWFDASAEARRDRARMNSLCCAPARHPAVEGAPMPKAIGS
jgi:ArsR family transcriptional regulator